MNPLEEKIGRRIRREGPICFDAFMDMALYDPEYGYYMAAEPRIGRAGDFYTSSHLHPVFGRLIGRQVEEMWHLLSRPDPFHIIEMGAGEGYVCADMLAYLRDRDVFRSLRYAIIERNPAVRQRQEERLAEFGHAVVWPESLASLGKKVGCFFSNELVDAFPVHLVEERGGLREICVGCDGSAFYETPCEPAAGVREYLAAFGSSDLPEGYRTEVNLRARDWIKEVAAVLEQGFVITIDYGYTAEEYFAEDRNRGTLLCYHGHETSEDPYQLVGTRDITAHVNFSSLRMWGEEAGLATAGFCPQGSFLISLGIDKELDRLAKTSDDYLFELGRVKSLFMPGGMGESHRVLVQQKGVNAVPLRGFRFRNQAGRL